MRRTGAIKCLAEATGAAAIAVSNLEALTACGSTSLRGVIIDARRGEIYAAIYDADLEAVTREVVRPAAGVAELTRHSTGRDHYDRSDGIPHICFPARFPASEQRNLRRRSARSPKAF